MMVLVKLISVELTFLGYLILLIEKDVTHNRVYRNGSSGLKTTKRSGTVLLIGHLNFLFVISTSVADPGPSGSDPIRQPNLLVDSGFDYWFEQKTFIKKIKG